MRYREIATNMHPARRDRLHDIASLLVKEVQWQDMREICDRFGDTEIIGVERLPVLPAFQVEVLWRDSDAAYALMKVWWEHCQSDRPHGLQKAPRRS
jgi:hypothetical protein